MEYKKHNNGILCSHKFFVMQGNQFSMKIILFCLIGSFFLNVGVGIAKDNLPDIIIRTMDDKSYSGKLQFVTDSLLVLGSTQVPFDSARLKNSADTFFYYDIQSIKIERKGQFLKGAALGALVGGGTGFLIGFASGSDDDGFFKLSAGQKGLFLGIGLGVPATVIGGIIGGAKGVDDNFYVGGQINIYKRLVPGLRKIAQLAEKPLTEQKKPSIEQRVTILQRQQVQTSGTPKPPQLSRFTRTHLTFSGMWSTSSANNNISAAFSSSGCGGWISGWFGSTKYPVTNGSPITWEIAGTYNLGKRLRIGLDMGEVPNWEVVGTNSLAESIAGKSYGISIHYVPRPYVTQNFSRWEIAYGAGVSYNSLMIDVHNRYSSSSHFSSKYKKIGLQFNCTFDYYFSKLFSIQLKINGKVVPKIVVPEIDIIDRYSNQMLQQHSVNFSMLNFSVGLGFHLGASLKK